MHTAKTWRTLSSFSSAIQKWVPVTPPISLHDPKARKVSLISWNIDAFSSRPIARAKLILNHILEQHAPNVVFLQEVTSKVRACLLDDPRIRAGFLVTDAEDHAAFENVPFATMTFLSNSRFSSSLSPHKEGKRKHGHGSPFRVRLPSKYGRDGVCVDIAHSNPTAPGTVVRFINVHLDSLGDALNYRNQQLKILADVLRKPGCAGGLIAGDFNAITPDDHSFVDKNGLVDAWSATLHLNGEQNNTGGYTWGVGLRLPPQGGLRPGRLDKVTMMGLKPEQMEVLHCGYMAVPRPGDKLVKVPCSDHCGIKCVFTI